MGQLAWKVQQSPVPRAAPARAIALGFGGRRVRFESQDAPHLVDGLAVVWADFTRPNAGAVGRAAVAALDTCAAGLLLPGAPERAAVLHAACVETAAGSVLLCAPSGGGKTTFAAALVGQGAHLVADDHVPVNADNLTPIAFPRALAIKPGAPRPDLVAARVLPLGGEVAPLFWVLPTARLECGASARPLAALVFLDQAAASRDAMLLPLPIAHAAAHVRPRVIEAPDGADSPEAARRLAGALAAAAPAFTLHYGDARDAAALLLRTLGA